MKNTTVTIIAGPCSLSTENERQLFDIAHVTATRSGIPQRAIWGLRVV